MPDANLDGLIEQLQYFRRRPTLFIRPFDVSHTEAFLQGVDVALHALGVTLDWAAVWRTHGFDNSPLTVAQRMQARGMAEGEITNKQIDLMIDALRRGPGPNDAPVPGT